MPKMKLTRKHRTFDCDLSDSSKLTNDPNDTSNEPNAAPISTDTTTNSPIGSFRSPPQRPKYDRDHDGLDSPNCLSKLVLSSSLHQLADSKYHTANNTANSADNSNYQTARNICQNMNSATSTANADASCRLPNHLNDVAPAADDNETQSPNVNANSTSTNPRQLIEPNSSPETTNKNPHPKSQTKSNWQTKNHAQNNDNNTQKREANLDTIHVVVGNESCDLDSAVSCLLMFHIITKMSDQINGKEKTRTLYIPLLNTTRDMLESKCEVLWFLQKTLNIDKSFLTCKDDIDWNEIKKNGVEVLITLVDHNYNEEFKDIGKIVEIIDHHQVQNEEWLMANHANLRLTLDTSVGSCTTLVAERLFYIYAEHHVADDILLLIYGTVLLDTICLSEKAKRFTRRDVYLLKKLDYLLGNKRPNRDELYKQLVDVKNSFKELNFEKLMKRDLKLFKDKHGMQVGIASLFGMGAKEALGLAANIDLDLFFRQNKYEAFIIMGLIADLDHSDSISRDLVLISANKRLFEDLCAAFEQDTSKLDLVPIGSDSSPDPEDNIINNRRIVDSSNDCGPLYKARIWLQRNVTSSRKVVAPLVLKVLHDSAQ